jgi:hypothetical protein
MAIATGTAILAGAALTAAGSAGNMIKGAKRAKDAQKALNNFKRQELKNVTEGMRVSTLGAELQTKQAQSRFESSVDALRSGGVRGLVGGLGNVAAQDQAMQAQIGAGLDQQQQQIDKFAREDQGRIREIQEGRESSAIAGLGQEIAAGKAQQQQGIAGIAEAGMSMLSAGINSQPPFPPGGPGAPGSDAITSAGKSAISTGKAAIASLSAPISANMQSKASSFQMPSSFTAVNPYAPKDYSAGFGDQKRTFFNLGNQ